LTVINGLSFLRLFEYISLAKTSLPTPLSPKIKTEASVFATDDSNDLISLIFFELPIILE